MKVKKQKYMFIAISKTSYYYDYLYTNESDITRFIELNKHIGVTDNNGVKCILDTDKIESIYVNGESIEVVEV